MTDDNTAEILRNADKAFAGIDAAITENDAFLAEMRRDIIADSPTPTQDALVPVSDNTATADAMDDEGDVNDASATILDSSDESGERLITRAYPDDEAQTTLDNVRNNGHKPRARKK